MRKLLWFSVGFGLSAFIGMYFLWEKWYFLAAGVSALLLSGALWIMTRVPKFRIAVAALLGCTIGFCWMFAFDSIYLSTARSADGLAIEMTVTALDYPDEVSTGAFVDALGTLNGKPYRIRLHLPKMMDVEPGDELTCRFFFASNLPGGSGDSNYCRSHGVFLSARSYRTPEVYHPGGTPIIAVPALIRQWVRATLEQSLPEKSATFAKALLIGDASGLDYESNTALKVSGIRHIIAVSGLHVTILFSIFFVIFRKRRVLTVLFGVPTMVLFAAVAGFSPSVTRACIMQTLMAISMLFNKDYDPPTSLAFAVVIILGLNPWSVTHAGFQMSVACIAGIFLLEPPIEAWLLDKKRLGRFKKKWAKRASVWVSMTIGVSVGAFIFVTPLSAYYFGVVSLVSMLTNLLTLWVVTFIFYGLLLICLLEIVWFPLAGAFGAIIHIPIQYILWITKAMAALPFAAVYTSSFYIVAWLVFCYMLLAVFFLLPKREPVLLGCSVVLSLCLALMLSWNERNLDECRVVALDVGQGQCILLQSEGKTFMVDCGGSSDANVADSAANVLLSQGITELDGMILTHYDRDHAGAASFLLDRIPAETLYLPNCTDDDGISQSFVKDNALLIEDLVTITYGSTKITLIPSQRNLSDNESGMCVLFQSENYAILITGDRSTVGELELMRSIDLPKLDVLVVGHHGSGSSTSEKLLEKVKPAFAFISVGQDNFYGHPAQETIQRLTDFGCEIYRTDVNGTLTFRGAHCG